ncbi:YiiX/YebB-like N1pC/P60 family cysteine hydrolase [Hellea balneolensis]|uniref:YiiX/YebB-like N1pC/P60 family cysteine hydrolase n=1 Tax=Hellea balneolensis TaxID=287478 RepID=UPI000401B43E|nr:YiiX/YebB-like N1pC/P60 family cysteine hydrolase [Hellea balneolensis]
MSSDTPLDAVRTLQASYAALPCPRDMVRLHADSKAAETRGYYDPIEDERLRETYASYLAMRVAIWQTIQSLKPRFKRFKKQQALSQGELEAFGIAFCGAEIIVRTGEYLIGLARDRDIVWKKLDEAETRYGIKRKSFTRLYRQLTSHLTMNNFYQARDYFDENRSVIMAALESEALSPIADILTTLNLPTASRGDHLRRYRRFVNFSLRRRSISASRNTLFALFEATGSDIAELKIPFVKNIGAPKRVTPDVIETLKSQLNPGDVFITRHDDAMSNLFLPGYWPHGALYIGSPETRNERGIEDVSDGYKHSAAEDINILEAKKDGVLLRPIEETLQVDSFVVLRPKLSEADINQALSKGLSHAGKLYDFIFNFATSDRLVCTEVIYRAYHGVGPISFELSTQAGRKCLSAEDFLNQAIANDWFKLVVLYGVGGQNTFEPAETQRERLAATFASTFTTLDSQPIG